MTVILRRLVGVEWGLTPRSRAVWRLPVSRPPLPLGCHGAVRVYRTDAGWRARTLVRDHDGRTRHVERNARTRAAAEMALKLAIRDRVHVGATGDLTPDTPTAVLAERWFTGLNGKAPTTLEAYRTRLDRQVLPGLGALRIRELTVGRVDRFLQAVGAKHGPAVAKMCRSVLNGMCGLAARHDVLDRNPVRDAASTASTAKSSPRALSLDEVRLLRSRVAADGQAVARDLPDLIDFLLATGVRIGEASALTWNEVHLGKATTVEVTGTVVRLRDVGLVRRPCPKTKAGRRMLLLPPWGGALLTRRRVMSVGTGPVFPAPLGGFRDPSNTQADMRNALDAAGFPWATSHVLRKTVATLMDAAGLSAREAADQLGHADVSTTQDVYMGRKLASVRAAAAPEEIGAV